MTFISNFLDWALQRKYQFPDMIIVDFVKGNKEMGYDYDFAKVIKVIEDGEEKIYPYSAELIRVISKEKRLPVFDATQKGTREIQAIISDRPDKLEYWSRK